MTTHFLHADPDARVLAFSPRRIHRLVQRALDYELEDVLCAIDRVDLVAPDRRNAPSVPVQRALRRVRRGLPGPVRELVEPRGRFLGRKDYDLLFVLCQDPSDLYLLGPLDAWKERCARTVCWIDEVWAHWAENHPVEMELLGRFDLAVLGCHGSVEPVGRATGISTIYQPPAVDTLRFCPQPRPPERCIDLFSLGRRASATHEAGLRLAEERGWFYFYDTRQGGQVDDHRAHRQRLASLIQRTRYFVANRAKADADADTRGQQEVGFRFFEGAAGGAIMLGEPPDTEAFRELFDWDGAVTPLPFGSSEVAAVIDALEEDPERLARIRRDNVRNALSRHDFAHRWAAVLDVLGLAPDPRLAARIERLQGLADSIGPRVAV